ncbi:hypothetical protein TWF506_010320 [Arthrobotrys conoides]|uniref:Uncharacterized protein n=1 Tax=Arthrobotrys conoides TaxID=74498 RepID=A0AAN8NR89_9PEZI
MGPSPVVKPDGKSPQLEASTPSLSTSPAKRTGPPISPDMFYQLVQAVQCATVDELIALDDDPSLYRSFRTRPQQRPAFGLNEGINEHAFRMRRTHWLRKCQDCKCDFLTGKLTFNRETNRMSVSAMRRLQICDMKGTPIRCEYWLNCRCVFSVRMQQPQRLPGITVEEYQDVLDRIPDPFKNSNPDYVWRPSPGWEMTWTKPNQDGQSHGQATHRELVPGTKEPYYLEGPDDDDTGFRGLPGRFYSDRDITSPFGKSSYVKRADDPKKADEGRKGDD